jgi:hypothetical protein
MTGPTTPAEVYVPAGLQDAAAGADEHLATCPSCSVGVACGVGDDAFEAEARAYTDWSTWDRPAALAYMRAGAP